MTEKKSAKKDKPAEPQVPQGMPEGWENTDTPLFQEMPPQLNTDVPLAQELPQEPPKKE